MLESICNLIIPISYCALWSLCVVTIIKNVDDTKCNKDCSNCPFPICDKGVNEK